MAATFPLNESFGLTMNTPNLSEWLFMRFIICVILLNRGGSNGGYFIWQAALTCEVHSRDKMPLSSAISKETAGLAAQILDIYQIYLNISRRCDSLWAQPLPVNVRHVSAGYLLIVSNC